MRRRMILIAGAAILVGGVAFVPLDTMWLHRGIEGPQCAVPEGADSMDFTSRFNSENRFVNGSIVRSLSDDPSPDCTKIGSTFRCAVPQDTVVQIQLFDLTYHYQSEAGAIIYGTDQWASCFVPGSGAL